MDGLSNRCRAGCVTFTMDVAPFDSCSGDDCRVAVGPVITAIVTIIVTRGGNASLRTAAELANANDQGFVEQTALIHI